MKKYLPLFLLMGLLAFANVSSTDYLYAQADVGDTGYLDLGDEYEFIGVYDTPEGGDAQLDPLY